MTPAQDLDVCILAGGHGTRLAGVWDKAKCLVPVGEKGTPLIDVLLRKVFALNPRRVLLMLGIDAKAREVARSISYPCFGLQESGRLLLCFDEPAGTVAGLAAANKKGLMSSKILVLNGDTLPLYNLENFIHNAGWPFMLHSSVAWCHNSNSYAGAALFDRGTFHWIVSSQEKDFSFYANQLFRIECFGPDLYGEAFYDVGTSNNFHNARNLKEALL